MDGREKDLLEKFQEVFFYVSSGFWLEFWGGCLVSFDFY